MTRFPINSGAYPLPRQFLSLFQTTTTTATPLRFEQGLMSVASAIASLRPRTRIIAVPLSRPRRLPATPGANGAPPGLTYYQFQLASRETKRKLKEAEEQADKSRPSWIPKGGLAKWAQNKAEETWASFGKAEGGWKVRAPSGSKKAFSTDRKSRGGHMTLERGWWIGWSSKSWR